ncbi:dirigent protein 15-like [Malania oleifera]|uniref:dirigent protein 15-like n=1 Tax=Malania oleifera TaxID=397392 RepID=UPI0025AE6816|nr:dirigent protein 15-like [Malania oleifera]
MEGQVVIVCLWVLVLMVTINPTPTRCAYYSDVVPLEPLKPNMVQFSFYVRETFTGTKPTAVVVAHPSFKKTSNNTLSFGTLVVVDDPITETPSQTASVIGSVRGYYASTASNNNPLSLLMTLAISFNTGPYNGSSFTVLSGSSPLNSTRIMSVVGGTGQLFMAGGKVEVSTVTRNLTTFDAVLQLKATVIYYEKPSPSTIDFGGSSFNVLSRSSGASRYLKLDSGGKDRELFMASGIAKIRMLLIIFLLLAVKKDAFRTAYSFI